MSGYTDTILIDCNRESSSEKKDPANTNYATFTCGVSDGLKLNVGDVVSVHSGFVAQRGCGDPNQVELTGKDLGLDYEVEATQLNIYQRYDSPSANDGLAEPVAPYGSLGVTNSRYYGYEQVKTTKRLKDNEMTISLTYYKTTNGEGYFNLPRRFDGLKQAFDWNGNPINDDLDDPGANRFWRKTLMGGSGDNEEGPEDTYTNGRTMGISALTFQMCNSDVSYYKYGKAPKADTGRQENELKPDTSRLYKFNNNNERMTLMVCQDNYYGRPDQFTRNNAGAPGAGEGQGYINPDLDNIQSTTYGDPVSIPQTGVNRDTYELNADARHYRDPCLQEWILYKETKDIKLPTGFQSPNSIASAVTERLNERGDFQKILGTVGGATGQNPVTTDTEQSEVTSYSDSETYKTFPCASAYEYDQISYNRYWGNYSVVPKVAAPLWSGLENFDALKVISYVQQYTTIGVKRPELWVAQRNVIKYASQINSGEYDEELNGGYWYPIGDTTDDANNKSWRNYTPGHMLNSIPYNLRGSKINDETLIQTSYIWNEANLKLFKAWFDIQGKDKSLFKSTANNLATLTNGDANHNKYLGPDIARYIHMNVADTKNNTDVDIMKGLGDDNYDKQPGNEVSGGIFKLYTSAPLWIGFDKSRAETAAGGTSEHNMYYGFAQKRTITTVGPGGATGFSVDVICFNTGLLGGIYESFWSYRNAVAPTVGTPLYYLGGDGTNTPLTTPRYTTPRRLGADPHFNGYGNQSICLYSGLLTSDENETGLFVDVSAVTDPTGAQTTAPSWVGQYVKRRYVGASAPALTFDTDENKYSWSALHTPEYTGNQNNAGAATIAKVGGEPQGVIPINPSAGNPVWFLNKRARTTEFCPDMMPYKSPKTTGTAFQSLVPFNYNLGQWIIFDADCGIFIDSFNIPENIWQQSLMGIMGFSWDQFNGGEQAETRQFRLNDNIIQDPSGSLTTNAIVNGADIIQFRTNMYGANFFNGQLPIQMSDIENGKVSGAADIWKIVPYVPVVSEAQTSASISSQSAPRKMLTPYYIIRSDLINDTNYQSSNGGKSLPIIYVVNKENGFGDFFFQNTSETTFTVTKQKIITSVTTSIHNPDMSIAQMSEGSGIIYKIVKSNNSDLNVASEILNKKPRKSK